MFLDKDRASSFSRSMSLCNKREAISVCIDNAFSFSWDDASCCSKFCKEGNKTRLG